MIKGSFHPMKTCYVPLSDLRRCLTNEKIDSQVQYTSNGDNYLENQALHYLCHHDELEDYSVFDFYQEYKSVHYSAAKGKRQLWPVSRVPERHGIL
jgi:hypothetical protein